LSRAAGKGSKRRRNDPALRRIEREFLLLSRLVSQLVSHHVFQLIHRTLFPLYERVQAKKTAVLLDAIDANRELGFKEMGLSEDLIVIAAPTAAAADESVGGEEKTSGTMISYQHASQCTHTRSMARCWCMRVFAFSLQQLIRSVDCCPPHCALS
jgi:hypothetical protein